MINFVPHIKTNTYVDVARRPRLRYSRLNKGCIKKVRNTKPAQGQWILEMILGPFRKMGDAESVMRDWKAQSRGLKSRRHCGIRLAQYHNVKCYDRQLNSDEQSPPPPPQKYTNELQNEHKNNTESKKITDR